MTHYILQTLAFQLLFLVVYDLFLKKETFFNYNRLYLLVTPILSVILPLVQLDVIQRNIPTEYVVQLPTILIGDAAASPISSEISEGSLSFLSMLPWIWVVGMCVSLMIFGFKVYKLQQLKKTGKVLQIEGWSVIELPETDTAFTFLKTIFIGAKLSEIQRQHILLHEKVHVEERHFADLLFFEAMRIVFWFNPLVYVFQKRIALLQEYKADAIVLQKQTKKEYYQSLLSQVFQVEDISFINTFFNHSLLKKRIAMLQKSKSKKTGQLKYLAIIPMICGMIIYSSCANEGANTTAVAENDTEVMDKINELAEAIMKKGKISDEEVKAIKFLGMETKEGDKIYTSVQEYLDDEDAIVEVTEQRRFNTDDDIPFAILDKFPEYPGCEGMDNEASKKCIQQGISAFVGKNFNTKLEGKLPSGLNRVRVQFKIGKDGKVEAMKASGNHKLLEDEAIRVISLLPQMIPGELDGKKVSVLYALPIQFNINE